MKCSELLRELLKLGWKVKSQSGSHIKLIHKDKSDTIVFPNHGSKELATGTEKKIKKIAGIK